MCRRLFIGSCVFVFGSRRFFGLELVRGAVGFVLASSVFEAVLWFCFCRGVFWGWARVVCIVLLSWDRFRVVCDVVWCGVVWCCIFVADHFVRCVLFHGVLACRIYRGVVFWRLCSGFPCCRHPMVRWRDRSVPQPWPRPFLSSRLLHAVDCSMDTSAVFVTCFYDLQLWRRYVHALPLSLRAFRPSSSAFTPPLYTICLLYTSDAADE